MFCWMGGVSLHGRSFGHEPRRVWPIQTGPQKSNFAGFASSSQGYSAPLQQGLKVEQAGPSEDKVQALISYSVPNRVQHAVRGSVYCRDSLFLFHIAYSGTVWLPTVFLALKSFSLSHLQHLSISEWDGFYHVSFPF